MYTFKAQDADFVVNSSLKRKPMMFSEQRSGMISLSLLQDKSCSMILNALKLGDSNVW